MASLSEESVKEIVRSSSEACVKAIEFDIKISDDKLQYSAWVLAAATAGFAIALTQSDKLISPSAFVGGTAGKWLVTFGALLFAASAIVGSFVKSYVYKHADAERHIATAIFKQQLLIEHDPSTVSSENVEDVANLRHKIINGQYLPTENRELVEQLEKVVNKAEEVVPRLLLLQQLLVGIGYAALFLAHVG